MTVESCAKCLPWLRKLSKARKASNRKLILIKAPKKLLRAIREIIQNILKGRINLKKKQKMFLSRYKKVLRGFVSRKKLSPSSQKRYLVQKGGFLPTLLVPVVSMLASVFAEKFLQ